ESVLRAHRADGGKTADPDQKQKDGAKSDQQLCRDFQPIEHWCSEICAGPDACARSHRRGERSGGTFRASRDERTASCPRLEAFAQRNRHVMPDTIAAEG